MLSIILHTVFLLQSACINKQAPFLKLPFDDLVTVREGDSYLVLDRDLSCLIKHIAKNLHQSVLCNCPVTKVVYDAEGAVVTAAGRSAFAHTLVSASLRYSHFLWEAAKQGREGLEGGGGGRDVTSWACILSMHDDSPACLVVSYKAPVIHASVMGVGLGKWVSAACMLLLLLVC